MIHPMSKKIEQVSRRFNLNLLPLVVLFFIVILPQTSWPAPQEMSELRQGRLHIYAQGKNETLTVSYQPEYGWDEPLLFLGPDGRLIKKVFLGHNASGTVNLPVSEGPGHYVLILKPSYLWHVSLSDGYLLFEPPVEMASVKRDFSDKPFFFRVPAHTAGFDFFAINHKSYKGQAARVTLFDPKGQMVADKKLPEVSPKTLLQKLKSQGVDISEIRSSAGSGNFNPPSDLIPTEHIHVSSPQSGIWTVGIGTTGNFMADNVGFWVEGIPSYFTMTANGFENEPRPSWASLPESDFIPVTVTVSDQQLTPPILGVVGPFGPDNGPREAKMAEYGIQAEKVFLSHGAEEPSNDNADPNTANLSSFRFNDQKDLYDRPGKFSLVVMDRFAGWLAKLPPRPQALEWAEWAAVSADSLITERKLNPDNFVIQFLNEPNKILKMEQYLGLLKAAGSGIKKNPNTRHCRIGAPAIAAGLSLDKQKDHEFLDTRWIEETLKQSDSLVDAIVFNVYGASDLEDTFLYDALIETVDTLIKKYDSDGVLEPIIIGATNREGGLVSNRLFCDWQGAVWWASVLTRVINTGKIEAINYFNIIDKGIRKKGLFTADRKPKGQAVVQKMFSRALLSGNVVKTWTDHTGLEAVSVRKDQGVVMILVNKSSKNMNASIVTPHGSQKQIAVNKVMVFKGQNPSVQEPPGKGQPLKLSPLSVNWIELRRG
nr:hypothetical protein [uncultured Desulfobacter sp.]